MRRRRKRRANVEHIMQQVRMQQVRSRRSIGYVLRREIVGKYQHNLLRRVRGILHVGANVGQERATYASHGLDVAWVEPIPDVFQRLQANIKPYPQQRAYNYLVTDEDNKTYTFHVASNDGSSSSILELADHKDIFPDVGYVQTLEISSVTLTALVAREGIDLSKFDMMLLDTQGSELLVLKGAAPLLQHFRFVQIEVADFEAYQGCCKLVEVAAFMLPKGFVECHRKRTSTHPNGGQYYEITYGRELPGFWEGLMV
jgi:FkbM family methyltransferase